MKTAHTKHAEQRAERIRRPNVSIVIKAYNEDNNIGRTLESVLRATKDMDAEIILADSHSSDRTIEVACRYPITIVQLQNPAERRCGVGPQLGYQVAGGDYVYILDGDMELLPGFLEAAIRELREHPVLAGVAGRIYEENQDNYIFALRANMAAAALPVEVDHLAMGGLYKREALESVGYMSDRNLHAFEELDLGLRLSDKGWRLKRVDVPAVKHYGHADPFTLLMRKRWRSGYLKGAGEIIRASAGSPYFGVVLKAHAQLFLTAAMWLLTAGALIASFWSVYALVIWISAVGLSSLGLAVRKRSLSRALRSIYVWQYGAAGLIAGLLAPYVDPTSPIAYRDLSTDGDYASSGNGIATAGDHR
ncbi:MAG: glycosyltransferase family A protein [Gammaproteobacteria bacterium]